MFSIGVIVKELVQKYKTTDPFELSDALGIAVVIREMENIKAFYTNVLRNRFIVISSNMDHFEQKIACAHELGHDRLHTDFVSFRTYNDRHFFQPNRIEREANIFACELLLSDNDLIELLNEKKSILQISQELKIHEELILFKLHEMKKQGHRLRISDSPLNTYWRNYKPIKNNYIDD